MFVFFGDPDSIDWGDWEKNRVKNRAALDARWVSMRDYLPVIARLYQVGKAEGPLDFHVIRESLSLVAAELSYSHTLTTEETLRARAGVAEPPKDSETVSGPSVAERINNLEEELKLARSVLATHEFLQPNGGHGWRVCGSCGVRDGSGAAHTQECVWRIAMGRK